MGDTQPKTFRLSPSALLSLPVSVCDPSLSLSRSSTDNLITAPALQSPARRRKSEVVLRYPLLLPSAPFSVLKQTRKIVTAVVDVKLDDVLERKHLPPLGAPLLSCRRFVTRILTPALDQASRTLRNGSSSSSKTRKTCISSSGSRSTTSGTPNG